MRMLDASAGRRMQGLEEAWLGGEISSVSQR
jgi:hypothetical protein